MRPRTSGNKAVIMGDLRIPRILLRYTRICLLVNFRQELTV